MPKRTEEIVKRLILLCFILLGAALVPWNRVESLIDAVLERSGLWIGAACVVGIIAVYIEITIKGLRHTPPKS